MDRKKVLFGLTSAILILVVVFFIILFKIGIGEYPMYIVEETGPIPENVCTKAGIEGGVIIYEEGVHSSTTAVSRIEEVERELGMDFEYIDITDEYGNNRVLRLGITPRYLPTVFVNCYAYVGVFTTEEYIYMFSTTTPLIKEGGE